VRILFLCKRRYMGKDLLADCYGRFFELPEILASRGHEIAGLTIRYAGTAEPRHELLTPAGVHWQSVELLPRPYQALLQYRRMVAAAVRDFRPEVIVGASDAFHVIYARRLGRKHGIPVVADLYDHFHAYAATWAPGIRGGLRRALATVEGVTCVSPALVQWAAGLRGSDAGVHLLPNGVMAKLFRPLDRSACRDALGLPREAVLVGTAGALSAARDIKTLYGAFERLARDVPEIRLVVAGRRDVQPPRGDHVVDLGELTHDKVPLLFGALDLGIVCNADSLFARYCDPQKLAEMRACGLPAVVADTFGGTLQPEPGALWLYAPGDPASLSTQIRAALAVGGRPVPLRGTGWTDRAVALESILADTIRSRRA
jgi:glycosyltransferase involved in cell wall biosynthesis